jgi:hypothetical protein
MLASNTYKIPLQSTGRRNSPAQSSSTRLNTRNTHSATNNYKELNRQYDEQAAMLLNRVMIEDTQKAKAAEQRRIQTHKKPNQKIRTNVDVLKMVDTGNDRKFEGYTSPEPFEKKATMKAV